MAVNVVELNRFAPRPYVFSDVAICLRDSIRAAGFESEVLVNHVDPTTLSLVLGAVPPFPEMVGQLDRLRCAIVNLEQLGSGSTIAGAEYQRWLRDWLVVDYHSRNVEEFGRLNGTAQQALVLPLVPSPSIIESPDAQASDAKMVDVLFYGTMSARRTEIVHRLQNADITVEVVAGAYGRELTDAIRRARVVLHVHFYGTGLFPAARILQPVVLDVPVVSETSVFSEGSDWSASGVLFADYDGLVDACERLLATPQEQQERAAQSQTFARQLDFATPFRQVLEAMAVRLATGLPAAAPPDPQDLGDPGDGPLSDAHIEAILAAEASQLPPESHLRAAPVPLVERPLGEGRFSVVKVIWVIFTLFVLWQLLR